ncbi:MAG: type II methionyl aminopeptidase [Candidatus Micrarchaeaceae archaeon]
MEKISDENLVTLRDVGKASSEAMLHAATLVKPGARLLEVAESAEKFLKDRGFGLAFPINLSVNQEAAHYTPSMDDERVFGNDDLVKVDFGAEKGGMLGDGAITIDLSGRRRGMVDAAEKALDAALAAVRHGVSVCDIGRAIDGSIKGSDLVPVKNLGGHGIKEHDLHAELFIPNYDNGDFTTLEEGMVVAIEPFVTTGRGLVTDGSTCEIYSYVDDANVRTQESRALLQYISENHSKEPFAVRWLQGVVGSKFRLYAAVSELVRAGAIEGNPTLVEVSGAQVAQAEAQVLVTKEACEVLTRARRQEQQT